MTANLTSNQSTTVQSFDRCMIESYLKDKDFNYLKDRDGDFQLTFRRDDKMGCELTFFFMAQGEEGSIYVITAFSDKPIPRSDWGKALMFCNTWNKEIRWPKAYLSASDPDNDTTGKIVLEEHIDLCEGIHQALLNDFTDTVLSTAIQFWQRAHQQEGF
ncbi:MAG: YbjN domain-containing protein [Microcystis flos-aquae TF09]|uniref:YbjN domain-containing protein n=1 Tax=Microcystis flos-aquae TF09 TaxID=2060473 RepID=A0A3E0KUS6_9CHRO|nr:MAG: YbjN domain-containing protein [Microcystis flos-aquae TF09]